MLNGKEVWVAHHILNCSLIARLHFYVKQPFWYPVRIA